MQALTRALAQYGHIDPIRDFGRTGNGHRIGNATVTALIRRGVLRETKGRRGVHFPTTTPAQVWDEAYAEGARRAAELAAYAADSANWVQAHPDGDLDAHTRQARDGQTILIVQH